MTRKDLTKKLKKVLTTRPESQIAQAKWRRENRDWLEKSSRIAVCILLALKEYGWSQKQLAGQMGVSPQQVSKIVKGKENLTLSTITKLEQVLDISLIKIVEENLALASKKLAEEKVTYKKIKPSDRISIINRIKDLLAQDGRIQKAWIFGSFARDSDHSSSDIDLMIEEDSNTKFSYFDLADIQHQLEHRIQRKVDIGFAKSLKAHAEPHIKKEAILIFEKS